MSTPELQDWREKQLPALRDLLREARLSYYAHVEAVRVGRESNYARGKHLRRQIARLTALIRDKAATADLQS